MMTRFIGAALNKAPNESVECVPLQNMAQTTFMRRLRESLAAKRFYGYKSDNINETQWDTYNQSLVVTETLDGKVLMGTRQSLKNRASTPVGEILDKNEFEYKCNNFHDLESLCFIWKNFEHPKPQIFIRDTSQAERESIESRHDVAFVHTDIPGKHFIV